MKRVLWVTVGAFCGVVSTLAYYRYIHLPDASMTNCLDWLECEECEAERLIESVDWDV